MVLPPGLSIVSISTTFAYLARLPIAQQWASYEAALGERHEALQLAACRALLDPRRGSRPELVVDYFADLQPSVQRELLPQRDQLLQLARKRITAAQEPRRLAAYRLVVALDDLASSDLLAQGLADPQPEVRELAQCSLVSYLRTLALEWRTLRETASEAPGLPTGAEAAVWQAFATALRQFAAHNCTDFVDLLAEFGVDSLPIVLGIVLVGQDGGLQRAFTRSLLTQPTPWATELLLAIAKESTPATASLLQQVFAGLATAPLAPAMVEQLTNLRDPRLLATLQSSLGCAWWPVVAAVAPKLGESEAQRLLLLLAGADLEPVRRQAHVEAFLGHSAVNVQIAAVVLLQAMRCPAGLGALAKVLETAAPPVRLAAARLAIDLSPPNLVTMLTPLLGSAEVDLRQLAMREVSKISFVRYLQRFDGMDATARQVAARALAKIDVQMLDRVAEEVASLEPQRRLKALQIVEFLEAGQDLQGSLLDLLADPDPRIRATAIRVVELAGSVEGIKVVLGTLADPDRRVRANAVEAFEQLDDPRFAQLLTPYLRDRDNRVRANAAKALWHLGCPEARDALVDMLTDRDETMRLSAVWAIGEIQFEGARDLLELRELAEPSLKVRAKIREVTTALGARPEVRR